MVRLSGYRVHLKTEFSAIVNGTDGDTYLHPVNAHFLRSTARLEATVSEMTTGVKAFFLKLIDALFTRKDSGAGAVVPIHIHRTRNQPSVGRDVGKVLK
jgi:hypothetical protein